MIHSRGQLNVDADELPKKYRYVPSEIALTKIVEARMKMISDALPRIIIILLTTCCPMKAATVATATKYRAAARTQLSIPI